MKQPFFLGIFIVLVIASILFVGKLHHIQNPTQFATEVATTTSTPISPTSTEIVTPASIIAIATTSPLVATSSKKQAVKVSIASAAPTTRAPITAPLDDQTKLFNAVVAIVCVVPFNGVTGGDVYTGTGVIVNPNGYVLTNAHVVGNTTSCFLGRKHEIPVGLQVRTAPPTIAIYYSLNLVAEGKIEGDLNPTENDWVSSTHDFAIFKIGDKIPTSEWGAPDAPLDIRTLNMMSIPLASDAEYAMFPPQGPFPTLDINFNYQPTIGDVLSLGGYIGSDGNPAYEFADGTLLAFTTSTITTSMPTGQGYSGSPIVDSDGEMVALNHATNCTLSGGCLAYVQGDGDSFVYGNNSLAISVSALDAAMEQDLGYGLKDLQTTQ